MNSRQVVTRTLRRLCGCFELHETTYESHRQASGRKYRWMRSAHALRQKVKGVRKHPMIIQSSASLTRLSCVPRISTDFHDICQSTLQRAPVSTVRSSVTSSLLSSLVRLYISRSDTRYGKIPVRLLTRISAGKSPDLVRYILEHLHALKHLIQQHTLSKQ
jgi:hypothetical protein